MYTHLSFHMFSHLVGSCYKGTSVPPSFGAAKFSVAATGSENLPKLVSLKKEVGAILQLATVTSGILIPSANGDAWTW